jgi:hypothetical protein
VIADLFNAAPQAILAFGLLKEEQVQRAHGQIRGNQMQVRGYFATYLRHGGGMSLEVRNKHLEQCFLEAAGLPAERCGHMPLGIRINGECPISYLCGPPGQVGRDSAFSHAPLHVENRKNDRRIVQLGTNTGRGSNYLNVFEGIVAVSLFISATGWDPTIPLVAQEQVFGKPQHACYFKWLVRAVLHG